MIGKTIPRDRIVGMLAGGGTGVVYKAKDTKLGPSIRWESLPPTEAPLS